MTKVRFTLDDLRRISPDKLDLSADMRDVLRSCTFCETEQLTRQAVDSTRALIRAGRAAGLNTRAVAKHYAGGGHVALSGDAEHARVLAHFAAGERGARVGAEAARTLVDEARRYARNVLASGAPWLVDVVDDDESR